MLPSWLSIRGGLGRGAWRYGPPPGNLETKGKNPTILLHCKQKTWCYFQLEYNKIIQHILICRRCNFNLNREHKKKIWRVILCRSFRVIEFRVVEFANLYLSVMSVRRNKVLLFWKLNILLCIMGGIWGDVPPLENQKGIPPPGKTLYSFS